MPNAQYRCPGTTQSGNPCQSRVASPGTRCGRCLGTSARADGRAGLRVVDGTATATADPFHGVDDEVGAHIDPGGHRRTATAPAGPTPDDVSAALGAMLAERVGADPSKVSASWSVNVASDGTRRLVLEVDGVDVAGDARSRHLVPADGAHRTREATAAVGGTNGGPGTWQGVTYDPDAETITVHATAGLGEAVSVTFATDHDAIATARQRGWREPPQVDQALADRVVSGFRASTSTVQADRAVRAGMLDGLRVESVSVPHDRPVTIDAQSSAVKGVAYDPRTRRMQVLWHSSDIRYEYDDVDVAEFGRIAAAPSRGRAAGSFSKIAQHRRRKVRPTADGGLAADAWTDARPSRGA